MKLIKAVYNFLGEVGRVRAASYMAMRGDHKAAERIMMSEFKGWI